MTAKYIKMGVEEWYTEVYKCISCGADTMTMNERYRQPRFCANCGRRLRRRKTMNAVSEDVEKLVEGGTP